MKNAHRLRINATPEQVEYVQRASGTGRFTDNSGREQWEKQYQAYKQEQKIAPEEQRVLTPLNPVQKGPIFAYFSRDFVIKRTFEDLKKAYDNFFVGRVAYPEYKKKVQSHDTIYLSNDTFPVGSHWISIPGPGRFILDRRQTRKNRGKLPRKQVPCQQVMLPGATASWGAGNWYMSLQLDIKKHSPLPCTPITGMDMSLKQATVVLDGRRLENQRPLASHLKQLGKLQRKLSKKQKTSDPETGPTISSHSYEKQQRKVARKHQQIAHIRRDIQHKFTTEVARSSGVIGIEDPNILADVGQSEAGASSRLCGHGATVTVLENASSQCGSGALYRFVPVSFDQVLFVLWACQKAHAPQALNLSVPEPGTGDRPGFERRFTPGLVRDRYASPTSRLKLAVPGSGYDR